jgi:YggT family protein
VEIVCTLLSVYLLVLLASIVLSWFPMEPGSALASVYGFLWRLTDPVLGPLRRAIPALRIGGFGLDLSPLIVIFGIRILQAFICG